MKLNALAALALVLIVSCNSKVDGTQETGTSGSKRLARIEYPDDSTSTMYFFYDQNGDIAKLYNGTDTLEYHYHGDSIHLDWMDGQGETVATQRMKTNGAGRVISNHIYDPSGALFSYSEYAYNPDGKIKTHVRRNMRSNDTFSMEYTYTGGDIAYVIISKNGSPIDRFGYEYDTTQMNLFQLDLENLTNDFFTNDRMGSTNKHLMNKAYRITPEGDTMTLRFFNYEFDADGYVVKRTDTDGQNDYSFERRFVYQ